MDAITFIVTVSFAFGYTLACCICIAIGYFDAGRDDGYRD